jgi:hypothetical protein
MRLSLLQKRQYKGMDLYFDDSPSVLKSAKQYGIGTVVAISKPSIGWCNFLVIGGQS